MQDVDRLLVKTCLITIARLRIDQYISRPSLARIHSLYRHQVRGQLTGAPHPPLRAQASKGGLLSYRTENLLASALLASAQKVTSAIAAGQTLSQAHLLLEIVQKALQTAPSAAPSLRSAPRDFCISRSSRYLRSQRYRRLARRSYDLRGNRTVLARKQVAQNGCCAAATCLKIRPTCTGHNGLIAA